MGPNQTLINNKCKTGPILKTVKDAIDMAHLLVLSGCIPSFHFQNPQPWASVLAVLLQGCELGMPVMASVKYISVLGGTTLALWGDPMLGLVRQHPSYEYITESYDEEKEIATCIGKRKDEPKECIKTFSIKDAIEAGLDKKKNYKEYKKMMLTRRALSQVLKFLWSDALMGISMAEEFFEQDNIVMDPANQTLVEEKITTEEVLQITEQKSLINEEI